MNHIKYFFTQFVFCLEIILFGLFLDKYVSKPFSYIDFIAIIIGILLLTLVFIFNDKLEKHLRPIRLFNKILLSLLAFFIAIIFIGTLTGEVKF